jgi:hypothetical protein
LPNILFIKYEKESSRFKFLTTKFVGSEVKESLDLLTLAELDMNDNLSTVLSNIDLFPEKLLNLHGKEVTLALFNYLPYVLWREVVSVMSLVFLFLI